MPIYEYQCPRCGTVFEEWVQISHAPQTEPCPKCGTQASHIISNTSFVLKGGGWYVTDYGYRKDVNGDKDNSSAPATAATVGGEATPAPPAQEASAPAPAQNASAPAPASTDTASSAPAAQPSSPASDSAPSSAA